MNHVSLVTRPVYGMGLLLVYSGLIYYLSSGPITLHLPDFFWRDKVLHAMAFGVMAMLAYIAFTCIPLVKKPALWAVIYAAVYGLSDEWHQFFVPGRSADWKDWVADMIGAILAIVLWRLALQWLGNRLPVTDTSQTVQA